MNPDKIDQAISDVERYLYLDCPKEIYAAWSIVADAADRYAGVLD